MTKDANPEPSRYRHSISQNASSPSVHGQTLLEILQPEIEQTIKRLEDAKFKSDPIVDGKYLSAVNFVSSAFKRHGYILEQAILRRFQQCPHFIVWSDAEFRIPSSVEEATNRESNEFQYQPIGRPLQIDAFVFDKRRGRLGAYEIKRGAAYFDAGKRRSMRSDAECVRLLLRSYGKTRHVAAKEVASHIIFYYGKMSVREPIGLSGKGLDEHFDWQIYDEVEIVNKHFKMRLHDVLGQLFQKI